MGALSLEPSAIWLKNCLPGEKRTVTTVLSNTSAKPIHYRSSSFKRTELKLICGSSRRTLAPGLSVVLTINLALQPNQGVNCFEDEFLISSPTETLICNVKVLPKSSYFSLINPKLNIGTIMPETAKKFHVLIENTGQLEGKIEVLPPENWFLEKKGLFSIKPVDTNRNVTVNSIEKSTLEINESEKTIMNQSSATLEFILTWRGETEIEFNIRLRLIQQAWLLPDIAVVSIKGYCCKSEANLVISKICRVRIGKDIPISIPMPCCLSGSASRLSLQIVNPTPERRFFFICSKNRLTENSEKPEVYESRLLANYGIPGIEIIPSFGKIDPFQTLPIFMKFTPDNLILQKGWQHKLPQGKDAERRYSDNYCVILSKLNSWPLPMSQWEENVPIVDYSKDKATAVNLSKASTSKEQRKALLWPPYEENFLCEEVYNILQGAKKLLSSEDVLLRHFIRTASVKSEHHTLSSFLIEAVCLLPCVKVYPEILVFDRFDEERKCLLSLNCTALWERGPSAEVSLQLPPFVTTGTRTFNLHPGGTFTLDLIYAPVNLAPLASDLKILINNKAVILSIPVLGASLHTSQLPVNNGQLLKCITGDLPDMAKPKHVSKLSSKKSISHSKNTLSSRNIQHSLQNEDINSIFSILDDKELSELSLDKGFLDFGDMQVMNTEKRQLSITNLNNKKPRLIELYCKDNIKTEPEFVLLGPGKTEIFYISLFGATIGNFTDYLSIRVNITAVNLIKCSANIIPPKLEMCTNYVHLSFKDITDDIKFDAKSFKNMIKGAVRVNNNGSSRADFKWHPVLGKVLSRISPSEGTLEKGEHIICEVNLVDETESAFQETWKLCPKYGEPSMLTVCGAFPNIHCEFTKQTLDLGVISVGKKYEEVLNIKYMSSSISIYCIEIENLPEGITINCDKYTGVQKPNSQLSLGISILCTAEVDNSFCIQLKIPTKPPARCVIRVKAIVPTLEYESTTISYGSICVGLTKTLNLPIKNISEVYSELFINLSPYPEFKLSCNQKGVVDTISPMIFLQKLAEIGTSIESSIAVSELNDRIKQSTEAMLASQRESTQLANDTESLATEDRSNKTVDLNNFTSRKELENSMNNRGAYRILLPPYTAYKLELQYQPKYLLARNFELFTATRARESGKITIDAAPGPPLVETEKDTIDFGLNVINKVAKQSVRLKNLRNTSVCWLATSKISSIELLKDRGNIAVFNHSRIWVEYKNSIEETIKDTLYLFISQGEDVFSDIDPNIAYLHAINSECPEGAEAQWKILELATKENPATSISIKAETRLPFIRVIPESLSLPIIPINWNYTERIVLEGFGVNELSPSISISESLLNIGLTVNLIKSNNFGEESRESNIESDLLRNDLLKRSTVEISYKSSIRKVFSGVIVFSHPIGITKLSLKGACESLSLSCSPLIDNNCLFSSGYALKWFNSASDELYIERFPESLAENNRNWIRALIRFLGGKLRLTEILNLALNTEKSDLKKNKKIKNNTADKKIGTQKKRLKVREENKEITSDELSDLQDLIKYFESSGACLGTIKPEFLLTYDRYKEYFGEINSNTWSENANYTWYQLIVQILHIFHFSRITFDISHCEQLELPEYICSWEKALLTWIASHIYEILGETDSIGIIPKDFNDTLRSGGAIGVLLVAHTENISLTDFIIKEDMTDTEKVENAQKITDSLKSLGIEIQLDPHELLYASRLDLILLISELYIKLPQLIIQGTLCFGDLNNESNEIVVELQNPDPSEEITVTTKISSKISLIYPDFIVYPERTTIQAKGKAKFIVIATNRFQSTRYGELMFHIKYQEAMYKYNSIYKLINTGKVIKSCDRFVVKHNLHSVYNVNISIPVNNEGIGSMTGIENQFISMNTVNVLKTETSGNKNKCEKKKKELLGNTCNSVQIPNGSIVKVKIPPQNISGLMLYLDDLIHSGILGNSEEQKTTSTVIDGCINIKAVISCMKIVETELPIIISHENLGDIMTVLESKIKPCEVSETLTTFCTVGEKLLFHVSFDWINKHETVALNDLAGKIKHISGEYASEDFYTMKPDTTSFIVEVRGDMFYCEMREIVIRRNSKVELPIYFVPILSGDYQASVILYNEFDTRKIFVKGVATERTQQGIITESCKINESLNLVRCIKNLRSEEQHYTINLEQDERVYYTELSTSENYKDYCSTQSNLDFIVISGGNTINSNCSEINLSLKSGELRYLLLSFVPTKKSFCKGKLTIHNFSSDESYIYSLRCNALEPDHSGEVYITGHAQEHIEGVLSFKHIHKIAADLVVSCDFQEFIGDSIIRIQPDTEVNYKFSVISKFSGELMTKVYFTDPHSGSYYFLFLYMTVGSPPPYSKRVLHAEVGMPVVWECSVPDVYGPIILSELREKELVPINNCNESLGLKTNLKKNIIEFLFQPFFKITAIALQVLVKSESLGEIILELILCSQHSQPILFEARTCLAGDSLEISLPLLTYGRDSVSASIKTGMLLPDQKTLEYLESSYFPETDLSSYPLEWNALSKNNSQLIPITDNIIINSEELDAFSIKYTPVVPFKVTFWYIDILLDYTKLPFFDRESIADFLDWEMTCSDIDITSQNMEIYQKSKLELEKFNLTSSEWIHNSRDLSSLTRYILPCISQRCINFPPARILSQIGSETKHIISLKNPMNIPLVCKIISNKCLDEISISSSEEIIFPGSGTSVLVLSFKPRSLKQIYGEIILESIIFKELQLILPISGLTSIPLTISLNTIKCRMRETKLINVRVPLPEINDSSDSSLLKISWIVKDLTDEFSLDIRDHAKFESIFLDDNKPNEAIIGLKLCPLRVMNTKNLVEILRDIKGGVWTFEIHIIASLSPPDDILKIKTAVGTVKKIAFRATSGCSEEAKFRAYFASDSSLDFTVDPSQGMLPPKGSPGLCIRVTFSPLQYGKKYEGVLMLETKKIQWYYKLLGLTADEE